MKVVFKNFWDKSLYDQYGGAGGICLDENGKICIVKSEDREDWGFPGGGREAYETDPIETFKREVIEEAQAEPDGEIEFLNSVLGHVEDDNGNINVELTKKYTPFNRFMCKLKNIQEFVPLKDGFETVDRKFVDYEELPQYMNWLTAEENGREFYEFLKTKL